MDFDHVALAMRDASGALDILVGEFGATILYGGESTGFRPVSVFVGEGLSGMQIELLEPWAIESNDFLERFLVKHGEGPHHITFKVKDLASEIERVQAQGYELIGIDLQSPWWKEAFFLPKQAHGTVVQMAQSGWEMPGSMEEFLAMRRAEGPDVFRRWWREPPKRAEPAVVMKRVVLSAPSLDETVRFFGETLRGKVEGSGSRWTDLIWPGGSRLRIEERSDRAEGIERIECVHAADRIERTISGTRFVLLPG